MKQAGNSCSGFFFFNKKPSTTNTPWNNKKMQNESIRTDNHRTEGTANIMRNICLQGIYFTVTKIAKSVYISVKLLLILF